MRDHRSNSDLLTAWRGGDERAAAMLFDRYLARLTAFARARLSRQLARRVDPEDIVLSAYRSFFIGARKGAFSASDGDDLWPLLVTITLRKITKQARSQTSAKRTYLKEIASDHEGSYPEAIADEPSPEQVAGFTEELQSLLQSLDTRSREVIVRLLNGDDAASIAIDFECSDRTVRRIVEQVRGRLASRVDGAFRGPETQLDEELNLRLVEQLDTAKASQSQADRPTYDFRQLVLREFIGQGAFSKVFRATETAASREVAVKFLRRSLWGDARAANGLLREFAALSQLRHPHVLTVLGWGRTPAGAIFLVTELLRGCDLAMWCARDRPSLASIVDALIVVAEGLAAAHAVGILHGDLKPQNVMREHDGRIVLMDFGMARWHQRAEDAPPRGGTAGYLCPEQISPAFGEITVRSDVYAWGGLAYCLISGQPPMCGRDLPETIANVLSSRPPVPLHTFDGAIPARLEACILRCLAKEAQHRPADMDEVLADLRRVRDALSPPAK